MGLASGIGIRIRTLTVCLLGLLAMVPASALGATQTIPGTAFGPAGHNLTIYIGDNGQLQAKSAPPGASVQGMFYGDDFSPASQHNHLRLKGDPAPNTTLTNSFLPVSNGPVGGNGTPSSPFSNVTVMKAQVGGVDLFEIRQTVLYTVYEQKFRVIWEITNIDSAMRTIPFIWGTSADLYIDASDLGRGVFIDGPNRFVGGTNDQSRTTGGIQEVTSSLLPGESAPFAIPQWASYQESQYSNAISRLNSNDSFLNTIEPELVDNGVGVSFDNRATSGLPPGQTQRYEVIWHANRPTPLSAFPAAAADELPGQHQVTLTLVDALFNPIPNQRVNYEITGANPTAGPISGQTDASGQLLVSWNGVLAGTDTLTAYADADNDGVRDPEEPATSATMRWLEDNHVGGAPQVPQNLNGPNGQVPVQVQQNPNNPEAPNFIFGRSATAAAGFGDCQFDQRAGRALNLPVTVNLEPGAGTISDVRLAVTDPSRHTPTNLASPLPFIGSAPTVNGNSYSFVVDCVVNGEMWVEFTLTENAVSQTFRIPIGGLALIDPQGVVYDGTRFDQAIAGGQPADQARATAAIAGATVHLQRLVNGAFVNVLSGDPGITPNVNPQTTGANGIYQWDVQAGTYRVAVAAAGCQSRVSPSVDIPPPVLDLHIRMDCGGASASATVAKAKPSNSFSIGKKPKSSKSGTTVDLEVKVPGPGAVTAVDRTPVPKGKSKGKAKASAAGSPKASPLFGPVSKTAGGAETVRLSLRLSRQAKAKLKQTGKLNATAAITYTPTGGDAATQTITIKFKKAAAKKRGKKG
jgi:Bacterial Ig-like domain (group 1)